MGEIIQGIFTQKGSTEVIEDTKAEKVIHTEKVQADESQNEQIVRTLSGEEISVNEAFQVIKRGAFIGWDRY